MLWFLFQLVFVNFAKLWPNQYSKLSIVDFFYFVMPRVNVLVACINIFFDVFCFSLFHNIGLAEVTWLSKVRME